jgi:hypothetical protein
LEKKMPEHYESQLHSLPDPGPSSQRNKLLSGGALILLFAVFVYVWVVPLFRSTGPSLWGHYGWREIYVGIPVALATLCAIAVTLCPAKFRRPLALRLTVVSLSTTIAIFAADAVYTVGIAGVGKADYWLDKAFISRTDNIADSELGFVRKPGISWTGNPLEREAPELQLQNRTLENTRTVHYRTSENGFRNPPGQSRADIVFIGDSYTEAAQVSEEDTFVQRVGAATGLSVANLGRGAYGPQQELIVLERYGLEYQPRFVVWQLFDGNDLNDARNYLAWRESSTPYTSSYKYRYLENSLITKLLFPTAVVDPGSPTATLHYHDGTQRPLYLRYGYYPDQPIQLAVGLTETQRAIEAGYRLTESRGIRLLVLFIPTMLQVLQPFITFDSVGDRDRYLPQSSSTDDFGIKMENFCAQLGCSYINTLPALRARAMADNRYIYFPSDEHLGIQGHEVVAEAVLEWIESQ